MTAESMPFATAIQVNARPARLRLVAHEIDHLHGILCQDHLPPGVQPIPVEQYRGTATGWHYHEPDTI